jgi:hypothetical protein
VPEADEAGGGDEEVEAEGEEADVEALLGEQHPTLVGVEGQQAHEDDERAGDEPEAAVGRLVGLRHHPEAPGEAADARHLGKAGSELLGELGHPTLSRKLRPPSPP